MPFSSAFLVVLLAILVFISAVSIVYSTHVSRMLINELQELQKSRDDFQIKWGRLLLEQSAWAAPNRIEQVVSQDLGMKVPETEDTQMIVIEK